MGTAILEFPLTDMTLLKIVLGSAVLCAALLSVLSFALGPTHDVPAQPPGLTAAAVLATDGMGPDGRMVQSTGAKPQPGRIIVGGAEDARPAG
ncbi:hypothetical protein MKK88_24250 [Methylobacterium sp. E-005]|uniref:hypothetical protein n=1 Tax=Methylobacterium sp. E-005 TaxID=2836549 RepID=UPI001FB9336E|nr:hypothetical protein [Methylobacterium sp. E-005]MCJ2089072.1 hypothetical protein [Methylobacterium sp. E-005]